MLSPSFAFRLIENFPAKARKQERISWQANLWQQICFAQQLCLSVSVSVCLAARVCLQFKNGSARCLTLSLSFSLARFALFCNLSLSPSFYAFSYIALWLLHQSWSEMIIEAEVKNWLYCLLCALAGSLARFLAGAHSLSPRAPVALGPELESEIHSRESAAPHHDQTREMRFVWHTEWVSEIFNLPNTLWVFLAQNRCCRTAAAAAAPSVYLHLKTVATTTTGKPVLFHFGSNSNSRTRLAPLQNVALFAVWSFGCCCCCWCWCRCPSFALRHQAGKQDQPVSQPASKSACQSVLPFACSWFSHYIEAAAAAAVIWSPSIHSLSSTQLQLDSNSTRLLTDKRS